MHKSTDLEWSRMLLHYAIFEMPTQEHLLEINSVTLFAFFVAVAVIVIPPFLFLFVFFSVEYIQTMVVVEIVLKFLHTPKNSLHYQHFQMLNLMIWCWFRIPDNIFVVQQNRKICCFLSESKTRHSVLRFFYLIYSILSFAFAQYCSFDCHCMHVLCHTTESTGAHNNWKMINREKKQCDKRRQQKIV